MTDELKPCPLTWAIQRLNSTPYSLTKDECVDVLRGLRDEIRALAAAQPAQADGVFWRVALVRSSHTPDNLIPWLCSSEKDAATTEAHSSFVRWPTPTQPAQAGEVDEREQVYSAQLTKAKRLLVDLHKIGGEDVRIMIEARTGPWFVWGQDRAPLPTQPAAQATPEPSRGMIGMGAHALANELAQAVAQDDADPDGHDMSAGLFGPNVSAWLRKISADYLPQHAPPEPVKPMFAASVAARKWAELQDQGHRMQSLQFDGGPGGAGSIDPWGKVMWATPEPVGEVLQFPPMPEGWPARFRCDSCDGNGEIGELVSMGHFQPPERQTCPDCGGRGWASEEHAFNADHMREFAEAHALLTRPAPGVPDDSALLDYLDTLAARPAGSDLHCFGGRVVLYVRTGIGSQVQTSGSGTSREAIRAAMLAVAQAKGADHA